MAKIKVSIINQTTLRLEEKGEIGDTIDLQELQKVDNSHIIEAIQNEKDEVYKALLHKEIRHQQSLNQIELNELENKLRKDYEGLITEKEKLSLLVNTFDDKLTMEKTTTEITLKASFQVEKERLESKIKELEHSIQDQKQLITLQIEKRKDDELLQKEEVYKNQILDKQKVIDDLNNNIKNIESKQELIIEKEMTQIKTSLEQKLLAKDMDIKVLNEQLKNKDEIKKAEIEKEIAILKQNYLEQISQKELEISQLRLSKSNLQVKMLGEDLERWCNSEYDLFALSGFENCKWYKDNVVIKDAPDSKGTKADYIFEVYVDAQKNKNDKLISVCCEMKNESPETKTKTKNSDHYDKLDKDRIKKNCQYSLLISELEWDTQNDAPIKKIPDYENMYLVRPSYFISFLSLIKSLSNKYQNLLMEHRVADDNFKDSQEIIEEFEKFKSTYLDKPLASLESDAEAIKKEAVKAHEAAYKIIGLADTIISQKISEIKVKIDRFDIKKIANKIAKLDKIV